MAGAKWSSRIVIGWFAFLSLGCTTSASSASHVSRAATVLFKEFETVFDAKADFVSGTGAYERLPEPETEILRMPFAPLIGGLNELSKRGAVDALSSADAVLVGAKDFSAPDGPTFLGSVHSRFCFVIVPGSRSRFDLDEWMGKLRAVIQVEPAIWKWTTRPFEGHAAPPQFYAAVTGRGYLLVANDLAVLKAVSAGLAVERAAGTISGIHDWEILRLSKIWGYRRYRHNETDKMAAGTVDVTPETEALAFFIEPAHRIGVLRLYSATDQPAKKWGMRVLPQFQSIATATWESTIPVTDAQAPERTFALMALFGFGVFL